MGIQFRYIDPRALRNSDWNDFFADFKVLMEGLTSYSIRLRRLHALFLQSYLSTSDFLAQLPDDSISEHIVHADCKRHETFMQGVLMVEQAISSTKRRERRAGRRLKKVTDGCTKYTRLPHGKEHEFILKFLVDLRGKYRPDIERLGLGGIMRELGNNLDDFDTLIAAYKQEGDVEPVYVRLLDMRRKCNLYYYDILRGVSLRLKFFSAPCFADFVKRYGELVEHYEERLLWKE